MTPPEPPTTPSDGGPAFPFGQVSEVSGLPINGYHNDGMTLRDWFAGQALAGELAHQSLKNCSAAEMVEACYELADWMITARIPRPTTPEVQADSVEVSDGR